MNRINYVGIVQKNNNHEIARDHFNVRTEIKSTIQLVD